MNAAEPARLVVALPPEEEALVALEAAFAMAERLEREIVAILLADERLMASAALPFTRIVPRTAATDFEFDVSQTRLMLRVMAERAKHRLERIAAARRVRWRIETAEGLEAGMLAESDLLAFAAASWEEPPTRRAGPVLVIRRGSGPLVLVHERTDGGLELARDLAERAGLPLVVLASDANRAAEAKAALGPAARVEVCPLADESGLSARLAALSPAIVLVEGAENGPAWRAAVRAARASFGEGAASASNAQARTASASRETP
ncbi:MAG: hypothetical protein N2038_02935 [Geminicoccaceae bacterium]|nr:hypothetical protein [Geminicoccaceae bacterium]